MDWSEIRALFPCTRDQAYLNTATYGPGPRPVAEAVTRSIGDWCAGRGDWRSWERCAEQARGLFAELIGVDPECVALLPSVSAAAAQVAAGLAEPAAGRRRIVVGEGEFRSNLFPWMAQERRGFDVHRVPFEDGRLDGEALAEAIDERTVLAAVSSVQSSNGYRVALDPVREACREAGARLYVDGTQSTGALCTALDGVDYLAVSGYKWLLAPRGTAFLYAAPGHVPELTPIAPGWKTPDDPYADYYGPPYEPAPRASRADFALAWHAWVGAREALAFLLELGVANVEARCLATADRFRDGLAELGLAPLFGGAEASHIVGVRVPDPGAVERSLRQRGVVAAVRGEYLRASFALFNDESDVERALDALAAAARPPAGSSGPVSAGPAR